MDIMVFGSIERMTSNMIHLPTLNNNTHAEQSGIDVHVTSLQVEHRFDLIDSKGNVNREALDQALNSAAKITNFPNDRVKEVTFNTLDEVIKMKGN